MAAWYRLGTIFGLFFQFYKTEDHSSLERKQQPKLNKKHLQYLQKCLYVFWLDFGCWALTCGLSLRNLLVLTQALNEFTHCIEVIQSFACFGRAIYCKIRLRGNCQNMQSHPYSMWADTLLRQNAWTGLWLWDLLSFKGSLWGECDGEPTHSICVVFDFPQLNLNESKFGLLILLFSFL